MKPTEIKIPKGCKATMRQDGNMIVIEYEESPKFKRGDFVKTDSYLFIYSHSTSVMWRIVSLDIESGKLYTDNQCDRNVSVGESKGEFMTESERQQLIDALHAVGKDWDAEKMEIVDWVWRPKLGQMYYVPNLCSLDYSTGVKYDADNCDERRIERGIAFKTPQEATEKAKQMLGIK